MEDSELQAVVAELDAQTVADPDDVADLIYFEECSDPEDETFEGEASADA